MQKEFIPACDFVHKPSIGNETEIRSHAKHYTEFFQKWYDSKRIEGVSFTFINRAEKAQKKLIFTDYTAQTNGVFPFLYLAIQFKNTPEKEIMQILAGQGYVQIFHKTESSA